MLTRVPTNLPAEVEDTLFRVIGPAIEVHRYLGPGYQGESLHGQKLDLVVESLVVVKVKAVSQLEEIHGSRVVSYLRATGLRVGLLINFNSVVLKAGIRRIIR